MTLSNNYLSIKDATDKNMDYVEQLAKSVNPDIIILDMGDKFATAGSERSDIYLKEQQNSRKKHCQEV